MSEKIELSTQPYKGARDFYPEQQREHEWVFNKMKETAELYGYEPYNAPMLESLDLYAAKSGRELVQEQVYFFQDRAEREIAVRPEMTPSLARMVAAKINQLDFPLRWFSTPNLWRYEKPQRGRVREHWQFNLDLIGESSMNAELEILEIAIKFMSSFGATSKDCQINISNRKLLNQYLSEKVGVSQAISYNISKLMDRREKMREAEYVAELQKLNLNAAQISDILYAPSMTIDDVKNKFHSLSGAEDLLLLWEGIEKRGFIDFCKFNFGIIRGLDYYTGTVFEMYDLNPENRRALFGGGRYDGLISLFGGKEMPAVGFGLGDVTIKDFLKTHNLMPEFNISSQVLVTVMSEETRDACNDIANTLRSAGIKTEIFLEKNTKLAKQFKVANRRQIPIVLVLGEDEIKQGTVNVKNMQSGEQEQVTVSSVAKHVKEILS